MTRDCICSNFFLNCQFEFFELPLTTYLRDKRNMDAIIIIALMFFGAYGAACLPFFFSVDESSSKANLLSALSGGLMLSSVLAVVIPEGFALWFGHDHGDHDHDHDHDAHETHDHAGDELPFAYTGLALVVGYLVMVAFDRLNMKAGHDCCGGHNGHNGHDEHASKEASSKEGASKSPESAIAGLLVHCVADGIAMGSAFVSGNTATTLILGFAMVAHKAPMAFGLSSFLMSCKWSWQRSQETIVWFSAAAPLSTMATYVVLSMFRGALGDKGVALAMLFSGGTFLHASTSHILPGVLSRRLQRNDAVALGVGSVLPILMSLGHHH